MTTWTDAILWAAVAANIAGGLFTWHTARHLKRRLQTVTMLQMLLARCASKQFEAGAMASHGWRAWAGTLGIVQVSFVSREGLADGTKRRDHHIPGGGLAR